MGRAPCCDKTKVKRGPWSPEEDTALKNYVGKYGIGGNWIALPQKAGLNRCGKSCRLRWLNYLRPNIKHGSFTEEEDNIILTLYHSIGSRWSVIAAHLRGRTDNDVKNYWNTKLKKKLSTITRITTSLTPSPNPCNGISMNITSNNVPLSETIYYENTNFLVNAITDPIEANEQYSRDEEYIGYNNFGSPLMPKEADSSTSSFSINNSGNSVDMKEFRSGFITFDDNLPSDFDFQEIMNTNYDDIFSYNSSTDHQSNHGLLIHQSLMY